MSNRFLSGLLLLATALLVARHLVALLPDQVADIAWMTADVLRAMGLSVAFGLCTMMIPWHMLRIKCTVASLSAYYVMDALTCVTWYVWDFPTPLTVGFVQGVGVTITMITYWFRSYDQPSDDVTPGYVYCVRHVPSGVQDFVISLCGVFGPNGGYAIYVDGHIYKFSRGRMVRRKVSTIPAQRYHVTRGRRVTDNILRELNDTVGMKWTLRHNCVTVLGRIWRRSLRGAL